MMILVILKYLGAFALVLGPLVFIHELGHFLMAKSLRIGVPVFSIGFGPRLFGWRRGGTDYRLSAIPLGGYVRLAGDEADENRRGLPEEFLTRPKWQRFLVFVAGATFNIVLAFLLFWGLFAVYGIDEVAEPDSYPTVRALVDGSPAERAGMRTGDTLIEIAGKDIRGYDRYRQVYNLEIALRAKPTAVVVERGGERIALAVDVEQDPIYGNGANPGWEGALAWGGDERPTIRSLQQGDRAEEAGLRVGDRVVAAGDREALDEAELRAMIEAHVERDLALRVDREGALLDLSVRPRDVEGVGRIGVTLGPAWVHRDLSLFDAAGHALRENLDNSLLMYHVLKGMLTLSVSPRSVSGPIGIAQVAGRALDESLRYFITLLAVFSLQLGILNLLPIPVLDGGHILILAVEGASRRELPARLKELALQIGFVFLLTLMGAVVILDVQKFF